VEAGYPALGNVIEWYGVVVPAATPRQTIARLNADIVRALKTPDVASRIQAMGQTVSPSTPEAFAKLMRMEYERWGKVVKASGAKVE
jgi:tripartite-type tricarboxylate transporter receptor subunit TctC